MPTNLAEMAQIIAAGQITMKEDEGSFVEEDDFHEVHTTHLSVSLKQSSPSHADGEIFDREMYEAEYSIIPQGFPLLMP